MEKGEEKERKKKRRKKKITMKEEGFPGARPTLLIVQWVTAVRCNLRLGCVSVFEFFSCT
jgi:hypothetical protein